MIGVRDLLFGIALGALVALLVHEVATFGLAVRSWNVRGAEIGRIIISGALIGAVTTLASARGKRR